MKKPVVVTDKPLLSRVSQTTPQFVQEKRVTVSESSSDSSSLQCITSHSKGIKPLMICEEEAKSSTAVIKEFENDGVDQMDDGKVNNFDNDHDIALLFLADHDEMREVPTSTELNKGSVHREHEVDLRAEAVVEGMDTHETISVNDQRVAHLSTDVNDKLQLIIKDRGGGHPTVRQPSKGRTTTASDAPLCSSTGISQSPLVLSTTLKMTSMKSCALCCDYAISPFEERKPLVNLVRISQLCMRV
ncbi:unnamed protein product [Trichobilharzia regenti]|nr:unnamed protein product [Trichobilharzia regenti]